MPSANSVNRCARFFASPSVAGLHVAELALEDPKRMLDLGPHLRDDPIDLLVELVQLTALGGLSHDAPEGAPFFMKAASRPA